MIITNSHQINQIYVNNKCTYEYYELGINVKNDSDSVIRLKYYGFKIEGNNIHFCLDNNELITIGGNFVRSFTLPDSEIRNIINGLKIPDFEKKSILFFVVDEFDNYYYSSTPFYCKNIM